MLAWRIDIKLHMVTMKMISIHICLINQFNNKYER